MDTRVQLRLLVIACLGVCLINLWQWHITKPQRPQLRHLSGVVQGLSETRLRDRPWKFRLAGNRGEFFITDAMLGYARVKRELERGDIVHIWVDDAQYGSAGPVAEPNADVWRIRRGETLVLSEHDVYRANHKGGTLRLIIAITAFIISTWARFQLWRMRRKQRFERLRRPYKPQLTSPDESPLPHSRTRASRNPARH